MPTLRLHPFTPQVRTVCFGLLILAASSLQAASGTQGAAFLEIPVGARPAALGSAYSALATDAYAPVWNAAGLGFLQSPQLTGQHLSYLESINYEHVGFVAPLGTRAGQPPAFGALGVSAQYLGSGDITGRDPSGQLTGDFSNHFAAYALAYGHAIGDQLSLGITGKWINAKLADYSANAYAVDLGSLYRYRENLSFAFTATNIGSRLNFISDSDPLPTALHTAVAYRPWTPWLVTAEGVFETAGAANGHFGVEWEPLKAVSLRTGYRTDPLQELSALAGFSTGIGLSFWGQEFSYAWVPYGDLGDTQYFSLLIKFGADEERKNLKTTRATSSLSEPDYEQLLQLGAPQSL